jgi:hypothetical protein
MRMLICVCLLCPICLGAMGCSKPPPQDAPVATAEDSPEVVQSLREATLPLSRRVALNRLKAIRPAANAPGVLRELEEVRKRAPPNEQPLIDETLAKIKETTKPEE